MLNRKKAPAGMYTAGEAQQVIGVATSNFYKLVRAGTIRGIKLPGRKEAYYPKVEVDRYARAIHSYLDQFNKQTFHFGLALTEDIPEIRDIVATATGGYEHTIPGDVLEAWIRKNPQTIHVLWKGAEILGYASILALPMETIMARLAGKLLNRTIPIDDIQDFAPGATINLYIAEMAVRLDRQKDSLMPLGSRLISETANFLIRLAEQKTVFNEIYAVGTTSYGIKLCRSLGFQPLDIPEGTRADRIPFKLDVQTGESHLISKYKKAVGVPPRFP